jgi:DNA replication and repair protein RecF
LARIKARIFTQPSEESVRTEPEEQTVEILLTHGQLQGKRTSKSLYSLNDVRKRKKDVVGQFYTVTFRPEDMRLIEGSPGRRRDYMDTPMQLISQQYDHALTTYSKALTKRNKLLSSVREGEMPRSVLSYWTQQLLKHGQLVQEQRRKFLDFCNTIEFPLDFRVEYDPSVISQARMEEYADREVAAGYTLVGPHKDDLSVRLRLQHSSERRDISTYGSRGQQRMAVLWLKQCEYAFLQDKTTQRPVLLLDDILSELDEQVRGMVFELLEEGQAIVTTADGRTREEIGEAFGDDLKLIEMGAESSRVDTDAKMVE